MKSKFIFVTGGVVSSLGKGITAASLGRLLKERGYKVTLQKLDPYINIDPGTMSPYQHGEVFVTEDGAETDLDLGHYERFTDVELTKNSSLTTGKIYNSVINKERKGEYLGGTVQVIPHITNEIKDKIQAAADEKHADFVITEIGGTVGDIESLPFLEAIRQFKHDVGKDNVLYLHVTLMPYLSKAGELKTKPTQHSVKELRSLGIQPDIIVCRSEKEITKEIKDKISLFCNIPTKNVFQNLDASNLYEVPLMLEKEGLPKIVLEELRMKQKDVDLTKWKEMLEKYVNARSSVKIGLVGKYVELKDAYLSVAEALQHGGIENDVKVEIEWIHSEKVNEINYKDKFDKLDGILIPGGFGDRGIEGKILAIKYARENKIPFLGICLGMQMTVVEFARNVANIKDAHSSELDLNTTNPVIDLMETQVNIKDMGGTMRLGKYPCVLSKNSLAYEMYKEENISERHRHRYEFNNKYKEKLEECGMIFSGISPDGKLVEVVEISNHPYFIAVQFHPEFKSRPTKAHPLFKGLIKAAKNK